ncbi:MAG TPA: HAD-IC family P-type ATPase [Burkholderiales bacterium]|nr:HAD-IC family P-type ATPase [Burkholderiales bacterium]
MSHDPSAIIGGIPPGLCSDEARRRLAEFGPNATPDEAAHPLRRLLGKFVAPVPCLLEAAIALQLLLGEYVEAGVIALLLVFNAAVALIQEGRAQATVAALKSRLALWASVRRDGAWINVPAAELVPGDVIKLSLGSVVPADVRLLSGDVLLDQSMITGESLPLEAGAGVETCASALVRRGEAVAEITATGARTKFGRAAELVRTAHVVSTQQKAIFHVVVNLAVFNGIVAVALLAYAWHINLPVAEFIPLALLAVLATVPVALPATFTLATALGSQALTKRGVLPTRLSAVEEAASMDVLCSDKTGTLTRNVLAVMAVRAMTGFTAARVLALAAAASSDGGQDPVDRAVRAAAAASTDELPAVTGFVPFDPATKMSRATIADEEGRPMQVVKGAFAAVAQLVSPPAEAAQAADELALEGHRVLAVGVLGTGTAQLAGLLALSDPPRAEAAACIAELRRLGIRVVMVTGDAETTAGVIAKEVGLTGPVHPKGGIGEGLGAARFDVFAGVLPEDKFQLVKALQRAGHTVGMCGDGANDAPALRQAQIGIAVSTATDVAKSAAGIVLTEPGLAGIVASVHEGRITFQRILTYTLRSIVHKARQVLFLAVGLVMTGHAILTPMMMVLSMITGDFLAMSSTTDNVVPSASPNKWRIDDLTIAGVVMGLFDLAFCAGVLAIGRYELGLDVPTLQTLTLVTLVFNGQAVFYTVRERRRLWSSRPSTLVILCSVADILLVPTLAVGGVLMAPLPVTLVAGVAAAAVVLAFTLDGVKALMFGWLKVA